MVKTVILYPPWSQHTWCPNLNNSGGEQQRRQRLAAVKNQWRHNQQPMKIAMVEGNETSPIMKDKN